LIQGLIEKNKEREEIELGFEGNKREAGGSWQKCHLLPPLESEQRRGVAAAVTGSGGGGAGGSSRGGGRGAGQNGEGDEGVLSPCSPWARVHGGGGSAGGSGAAAALGGRRRGGARGRGEEVL
jgi:hypothetical protein